MDSSDPSAAQFVSPGAVSSESFFDEYAANPRFQQLQTELRSWLFVGATSGDHTRENSVSPEDEVADSNTHQAVRSKPGHQYLLDHVRESNDQIPLQRKLRYLHVWITDCAPWLDMFDAERHFGIRVPILAQDSAAVFHALLAVAARTAERQGDPQGSLCDSLELYSQAITSLTSSLDTREPNVMVTACLLCVLEMMSSSPRDWRRHVEGCAALFVSSGINGFSGGLLQAVFWCYARMDLCGAIIADGTESTVLTVEKWALIDAEGALHESDVARQQAIGEEFRRRGQQIPDMYANYAVYLCARVCDLLARRTRHIELGEDNGCDSNAFGHEWTRLWDDLQEWLSCRPTEMTPVKSSTNNNASRFPSIFFAHWAAISSNQLYHTACILMLEMKDDDTTSTRPDELHSTLWHARRIIGISLTNPHPGCINNAIQPLFVAGKLFTHREEQKIIVELIDSIEARTGWGSRWRIKDLEAAWGYRRGTFT
ncbi:hypothetical protein H2202_002265 [Exophiala xenobiotica]|nr:hypothetical protein H2202_002265 [Exophiala xenobiotica]KAK5208526.1 hypothetical protein LTR41_005752 [Exophiala xenobiotica]KAK5230009.1 hypothetical protein LTR72_001544 [Exophiala xenobiotica]KAK5234847.1 hypothetical protein LTR47_004293 [Exophiala xenobiotica]KAK5253634.1 hypothetical protein LTS06_002066 [Exophiala xenobiotica]